MTDEQLARLFHETYERLAPQFDYRTRKASAVPWEQVPEPNKSLMIAVAGEVRTALVTRTEPEDKLRRRVAELLDALPESVQSGYEYQIRRVNEVLVAAPPAPQEDT